MTSQILAFLVAEEARMVGLLKALTAIESPTDDLPATRRALDRLAA